MNINLIKSKYVKEIPEGWGVLPSLTKVSNFPNNSIIIKSSAFDSRIYLNVYFVFLYQEKIKNEEVLDFREVVTYSNIYRPSSVSNDRIYWSESSRNKSYLSTNQINFISKTLNDLNHFLLQNRIFKI